MTCSASPPVKRRGRSTPGATSHRTTANMTGRDPVVTACGITEALTSTAPGTGTAAGTHAPAMGKIITGATYKMIPGIIVHQPPG